MGQKPLALKIFNRKLREFPADTVVDVFTDTFADTSRIVESATQDCVEFALGKWTSQARNVGERARKKREN
ncbi:hypothetical protein [Microbulbifer sp. Q7]|uniref:hypothetical protein n=1 Tax=Microbulbifer sp. Q7 TaxID=1785091 RepID=UPI00082AF398|nr:hypothetical protein [Microbulbifer sp. Q7]